ncbi:MAG TPA: hypothetical protein VHT91_08105 [Kofleriaceae bacterium]|nr:hypothetical protein [Kofleriaceae bacterium]
MKLAYTLALIALTAACASRPADHDAALALSIAKGLVDACPGDHSPADEAARNDCADKLTSFAGLRNAMREPFIWADQLGTGYQLDSKTHKFNARVWRRMYLSTFMFGTDYTIEQIGDMTVLHMPVRFRGAMSTGAYPYPFWHSEKKWDAYNYATTVHFIFQNGGMLGALRSAEPDRTRPKVAHTWDGLWRWQQAGVPMPYVALYDYLFAKDNPYTGMLDEAYRALEAGMRPHHCNACHAPDKQGESDKLEFFVYPNQALSGRHDIVSQVMDNTMPPEDDTLHLPAGIADPSDRDLLLKLARDFEVAGDEALAWEGDKTIQL